MSRRLLIKTCILLTVATHASCQFDFFERFNSFLQPLVTAKPKNAATKRPDAKHRQTNKLKYQDLIFFETDDFLKRKESHKTIDPFTLYSTTTKPRRKSTKTTTTSHSHNNSHTTQTTDKPSKSVNSNKIVNNNRNVNHEVIRSISSNNRETYNNNVDNPVANSARRIDNYNGYNGNGYNGNGYNGNGYNDNGFNSYGSNAETTTKRANNYGYQGNNYNVNNGNRQTTEYYNNPRQTTQKPTDYYNNGRQTTQKPTDYYNNRQTTLFYEREVTTRRPTNNRQTTSNPLLNRPGVKPAAVDENRPPITNRPVTSRPVTSRPVTSRPVTSRPYDTGSYRPPVNTRPPFEPERPISSGVVRPISSGVIRPVTSANRPSSDDDEPEIEIGPDEDEMSESEKRRLYDICEQKCDEYKAARVKKVVALPLSPNNQGVEVNVSSCAPANIPLIIGGVVVQIQQFPHMALVGWKKLQSAGYSWKCGGSLVSERYVLTAGHCTYHDKDYNVVSGPPAAVQLGSSLYNDRSATVIRVAAVIRHPKYKIRRSYYDVALIRLKSDVTFSDKISPACLGVPPPVGEPIIATGWGKTEYGGDSSIELRSVSIPIWDMNDCREIWGTSLKLPRGPLPDNQICAGERKGAKDTCQGDSGGPAQVSEGCAWRVVAVTSVGRSCGAPDTPALYATIPRAFIAAQVYSNTKPSRDGNNQYGNNGVNGNNNNGNTNNNNGNTNNNWGSANSNSGNSNFNSANNNRGEVNNQYGNQGVANVRPAQNNNGQNYDNGRAPNNNGQNYGNDNNNNNWNTNNGNNYNTAQNTNNYGSGSASTTNNNRYNENNGNNNNQNNRNVYDQSAYGSIAQIYRTTTTPAYNNQNNYGQNNYSNANNYNNANNYGQSGYNNEQNQNRRTTERPTDIRNYGTQSYGYNDNGNTGITFNRDNNNRYNDYPVVVSQPWWTK